MEHDHDAVAIVSIVVIVAVWLITILLVVGARHDIVIDSFMKKTPVSPSK